MGSISLHSLRPRRLTSWREPKADVRRNRLSRLTPSGTGIRDLFADQALWGVLLVWAVCWLGWSLCIARIGSPFPYMDECDFVRCGVATGETPITWGFLWAPANEHRAPLLRLWVVLLGRFCHWDSRPMLQVNLALLALAALALVLAVRAVRGRSALGDSFLPLLVLTSANYESLLLYVYAYAMPLAFWCLAAAAVILGWPLRSTPRLLGYLACALILTWAGGPAGNLLALGLCVPLARGWIERTSLGWKSAALLGAAVVVGSSLFLLYSMPPSPTPHLAYISTSRSMTLYATAKFSVGWMGDPILQMIWPWALVVVVVPALYLLVRFLGDVWRQRFAGRSAGGT